MKKIELSIGVGNYTTRSEPMVRGGEGSVVEDGASRRGAMDKKESSHVGGIRNSCGNLSANGQAGQNYCSYHDRERDF